MSRGGSANRPFAERSAAARKGWLARRRRAVAEPEPAVRGSQADRVLQGEQISALLARIRARAKDGAA